MPVLDLGELLPSQRSDGAWAAGLVHALAREEASGRRTQRLTEAGLATWKRFKGRLSSQDFLSLLFEDAAVLHPVPFDSASLGAELRADQLPQEVVDNWLEALPSLNLAMSPADYIFEQARLLGLPTRMARSDLHVVKPHQRVLELPGTGGQLAHHLVTTQTDLSLQANFVIACDSWQAMTLAGIIGLERGAPNSDFIVRVDLPELRNAEHPLRRRSFDFVLGLHPDKGGLFRIEDQLAIWFPSARVLLV
jgi:hypothetical protein